VHHPAYPLVDCKPLDPAFFPAREVLIRLSACTMIIDPRVSVTFLFSAMYFEDLTNPLQRLDRILIRLASPPVRHSCDWPHPQTHGKLCNRQKCQSVVRRHASGRLALLQVRSCKHDLRSLFTQPSRNQRHLYYHSYFDSYDHFGESRCPKHYCAVRSSSPLSFTRLSCLIIAPCRSVYH
jgi:hypothetical protein